MKLLKWGQALISIIIVSLVVSLSGAEALNAPSGAAGIIFISPGHYVVTFHNNWPIGIGGIAGRVEVPPGETISQLAMPTAIPPPQARYGFRDWNTSTGGSGQTFDSATPINRHRDVFAIWDVIDNGFIDDEPPDDGDNNNIITPPPTPQPPPDAQPEPPTTSPNPPLGTPTPELSGEDSEIQGDLPAPPIVLPPDVIQPGGRPPTLESDEIIEIDDQVPLNPYDPQEDMAETESIYADRQYPPAAVPPQVGGPQGNLVQTLDDEAISDEARTIAPEQERYEEQASKDNEAYKLSVGEDVQDAQCLYGQTVWADSERMQSYQADRYSTKTWALANLIFSLIGTVLTIIFLLNIIYLKCRKKFGKIPKMWLVILLSATVTAPILFSLTQNMDNTMVIVDFWTIMHCILIGILVVSVLCIYKKDRGSKEQAESDEQIQAK